MKVLPYKRKITGTSGYVVIEVPIWGDVIRRGLFWNIEDAELFAHDIAMIQVSKQVTDFNE